ncbi:uncharacterized protein LOC107268240 [Cephus cinctus]|uniref:Uncharacterized protein LOC107268240 n=1 Tax=Cephus cinctus TaxID=211228 RepID=A0AAJ7W1U9_CEPCN|nr:uncharacterized protein LOC107268240 [Cephus cinctus]XP_015596309.1 uncharacterized protein LOC107268240 [Cephus cinctus]XP_015596310.1 uncharacterized protein LOC107268240 [Cephus cinctus]XP_015596312.1 uncharacterized protein LOC107268240 [Cephus cinctus]XP_024941301.1 uncharacterized protein LOC107268240 [Cephus cinctus]
MAAKSKNSKEALASTSSNIVSKIHKMEWLKQDPWLNMEKSYAEHVLKDLPSKKDDEYFSGTKSTKKKKEKKPKPNKIIDNIQDNVTSDNVQSTHSETTEKSAVPTRKKSNQSMTPNTNPVQSDIVNPWNQNTSVVDVLFPNVQSTTVQCMNEEEMLSMALAESIATAQLEYHRKETNEQKNPSNILYDDSDDDGGWGVVKRNLPDLEEITEKQTSHNLYDSNNNDNIKCSSATEIQAKFSSSGTCKDKDLERKPGTVKPILPSSVKISVENSNDKCTEGAGSLKKDDVDDLTKSKDMQISSEKSDLVSRPDTSVKIDKYGRVGGYTERHLFMGRGARRKEQEYFKEHGAALGLIKLPDQNSNRQLPKKSEDTKKMVKPSDYGFFRKSGINIYQESNQLKKSDSNSDLFPTDFRYSRGNDKYSENRQTKRDEFSNRNQIPETNRYQESNQLKKSGSDSYSFPTDFRYSRGNNKYSENRQIKRDEFSSRNKIHGELRSIRGTGANMQKIKEQDTADSHNQRSVDLIDNMNSGMKFEHSHEIQESKMKKSDINSEKIKFLHDIEEIERSTSTPEPKGNLSVSRIQKSKLDESLTSVVPDTTTELMPSTQNSNNSLIQNSFAIEAANDQSINNTEGKSDANFKDHTDINNVNNDSSKHSAQSCVLNDSHEQIIDSPNSQVNHLLMASSSIHEQIALSAEHYAEQSARNLKELQCLQYLQYLQQQCEGTKSENYNYPNIQSQTVQSMSEISPLSNSQYANLAGPAFPDPNYLLPNMQSSNTLMQVPVSAMQVMPDRFSPTQNLSSNLSRHSQFAYFPRTANITFPNGHPPFSPYQNVPVQSMQRENMYQECGAQANLSTGISQSDYLTFLAQNSQNLMRNFASVQNPLMDLKCQSYHTDNNSVQMMSSQNLRERVNLSEVPATHYYNDFFPRSDATNERGKIENCTKPPPGYKSLGTDYEKDNQISSEQKRVIVDNFEIRLPSFHASKDQIRDIPQANPMPNFPHLPQDAQTLMTLLLNAQVGNQFNNNVAGNLNYYNQTGPNSNMMDYTQSMPYQFQMNSTNPVQTSISNLEMARIPISSSTMKITSNSIAINSQNDNSSNEQYDIPPMISPLSCMNYNTCKDSTTPLNSYQSYSQSNIDPRLGIDNIAQQNSYPLSNKDPGNKCPNLSIRSIGRGRGFPLKSKNL